jgi:hypothetical protein
MKSNFVSSVSHELRAPIASVRLMAESLERGKISEPVKQHEYFRFIVQECRRLSSLIENVLDFSRIEQGRKQYEFEPTNVTALVEQTVKLMEPCAAEKGVRLELETSNIEHRTSNIERSVDGRALQQALANLIDNAIKHSPKGEAVTVGIRMSGAEGQVSGGPKSAAGDHGSDSLPLDATRNTQHAALPHTYIPEPQHRIEIYRKLAQATDKAALETLVPEIRDRFGPLPPEVELLLAVTELKILASEKSVTSLEVEDDKLKVTRHGDFVTLGGKFPRLTKKDAKGRLKEIKKLLLAL